MGTLVQGTKRPLASASRTSPPTPCPNPPSLASVRAAQCTVRRRTGGPGRLQRNCDPGAPVWVPPLQVTWFNPNPPPYGRCQLRTPRTPAVEHKGGACGRVAKPLRVWSTPVAPLTARPEPGPGSERNGLTIVRPG
uniref:Uncharacterized protein n=1 Tax=Molossus molossus TaxID=27622 RepID=A0A7J8J1P0_MOLMO|nr:hypothetical protein HJG59_010418 [Molossus molossus]